VTRGLLLLRHAKSSWPPGVPDPERPLAPRGERSAQRIGRFLADNDLRPDRVVTSPARRTRDTAARVLKGAGSTIEIATDERLYGGDASDVVAELLPASRRLLVVGHEPELLDLLLRMTGAHARMPTAGLAWMEVDDSLLRRLTVDGELGICAVLQMLITPRLLAVE
jgi:phosphohistidine phosphatase